MDVSETRGERQSDRPIGDVLVVISASTCTFVGIETLVSHVMILEEDAWIVKQGYVVTAVLSLRAFDLFHLRCL